MLARPASVILAVGAALAAVVSVTSAQAAPPGRVPRAVLERYVGEYVYPDGNTIAVTLKGDTLFREVPGQRVMFVPISETLFRVGPVFTAEFLVDPAGRATQILTDGADVEFRLHRKSTGGAAIPAASAAAVRVPRAVLQRYVGIYEYIPGQMSRTDLRIIVRLKGDTLVRIMSGANESILTPLSPTRFRVGETSLTVEFVVDDAGVTQVLGTGFQQMLARLQK